MKFDFQQLNSDQIDAAARYYEENGFLQLTGLESEFSELFEPLLQDAMGMDKLSFGELLDPTSPREALPVEIRKRLSRVTTPVELKNALLAALKPLLLRMLGPLVHVSSSFHAQVKEGASRSVDHGGYVKELQYTEVQGPYLLHQDFAGASFPTTPSMLILWVPLNSTSFWNLRLYPKSHRKGLLCNRWWDLEDPRLANFADHVDIQASKGTAVIFNSLMLHGTSNSGRERRLSCDIRFFPLCGFLPSEVYALTNEIYESLENGLLNAPGAHLQAPLIETLTFLGREKKANELVPQLTDVPKYSILNWCKYIEHVMKQELDHARIFLERFVNQEIGSDAPEVYSAKFHGYPLCENTLKAGQELAARGELHG